VLRGFEHLQDRAEIGRLDEVVVETGLDSVMSG
jgi:hypothetical protein